MICMADTWIRLLGPPRIESAGTPLRQPRGRKAWAVLAYLALQPDGTGRARTAALLFPDAWDSLGALRWNLSELRRTIGAESISGDPLRLVLPPGWRCDVLAVVDAPGAAPDTAPDAGADTRPADPRTFDGQLLEGLSFGDTPVFESWLEDQRHRLENGVLSLLYEASLAALAAGQADDAVDLATRALQLDPFNADCHAVLVRALVSKGDHRRAREQVDKCRDLYREELGLGLPVEVGRALSAAGAAARARDAGQCGHGPLVPGRRGRVALGRDRWTAGWISCGSPSSSPSGQPTAICSPSPWWRCPGRSSIRPAAAAPRWPICCTGR